MKKRELIEKIRQDYSKKNNTERTLAGYANSIKKLAGDLYAKDTHFIFELVQNAEDNKYSNDPHPSLHFRLEEMSLNGDNKFVLLIENNEVGFNDKNVEAICTVGDSTKTKNKNQGYIGEKGIGFKSVFKVTSCPRIFSNGFSFALPEKDEETGLGYIVPKWTDNPPQNIKSTWTTIILPLDKKEEDVQKTIEALKDIASETILFLKKLKSVEITISLPDEIHEIIIEKSDAIYPVVELTYLKNLENIQAQKYWCGSLEVTKPDGVNPEERQDIMEREVSVALPLNPDEQYSGKLFAYLPVWENTGLPFLINADFLLVSSREGIREDEPWNIWLRDSIPDAYTKVFMDCLKDERLPEEEKYAIHASIPFSSHRDFLEPVCENIHKSLKDKKCLITEPDGHLRKPEHTRTASKKFRELLDGYPYPKLLQDTSLIRKQLEPYKEQLKSIGVQRLSSEEICECFHDHDWIALHDYDWLIKCYNYLSSPKFNDLSQCPIVPVKAENGIRWTYDKEQPVYFECKQTTMKVLSSVPDWIAQMVPIEFMDIDFLKLLQQQEKWDYLKEWMRDKLEIHDFSIENYCVDILEKLKAIHSELEPEKLIGVTEFLIKNAGDKFSWNELPIILSDSRVMPLCDVKNGWVQSVIVPENYDPETGWQQIWTSEQLHFLPISDNYPKEIVEKFIKEKVITEYPMPRRSEGRYIPYSVTQVTIDYEPPENIESKSFNFNALLKWLKNRKHEKTVWPIKSYFSGDKHEIEWACQKIYYEQEDKPYKNSGTYKFRCEKSSFYEWLLTTEWLPTTKGFVRPSSEVFLSNPHIKEVLGDSVPYFEGELPDNIVRLLGIRNQTQVTSDELISVLKRHSQNGTGSRELAERIYQTLSSRELDYTARNRLKQNELIFIPDSDLWVSVKDDVIWKDRTDVLGSDFIYLEKIYPKLEDFFIETLGINEDVDTEIFTRRWLKLQEVLLEDKKEQQELVENLYREIRPIAIMDDEKPDWWDEFIGKAKIYTQSDTFEEPEKVLVPDNESLREIFSNKGVSFAWRPKNGSFNNWVAFCKAFGTPLLSESVSEKLAEYNEDDEVICGNRRLTGATVKMIAAWLREDNRNDYDRLFQNGSFRKLFEAKEVEYDGEVKVYFSLKTTCLEMEEKRSTSVFWDAANCKLIYHHNVENDDIANRIAKWLLPNRNSESLASWIENILGAENTNRLDKKGWKVPQEILELSKELDASDDLDEEVESGNDFDEEMESADDSLGKADPASDSTEKSEDAEINDIEMTSLSHESEESEASLSEFSETEKSDLAAQKSENQEPAFDHSVQNNFDFISEFKNAFDCPGAKELKDKSEFNQQPVRNPERRKEKEAERHIDRIKNEPDPEDRRRKTERTLLEGPDPQVRQALGEWYGGKCQICSHTFLERNGQPFFIANHIVQRKFARQADTRANALCLCAEHFAKWQHGTREVDDDIVDQIKSLKLASEGGDGKPQLQIRLCGEECVIKFDEKHVIALQEMLNVAESDDLQDR